MVGKKPALGLFWLCARIHGYRLYLHSVFSTEDQKYTYEVKKANIDQQRVLCHACWLESNRLRAALKAKEVAWAEPKLALRTDAAFLNEWQALLLQQERYIPYKPDTARKNMIKKLLRPLEPASDQPIAGVGK